MMRLTLILPRFLAKDSGSRVSMATKILMSNICIMVLLISRVHSNSPSAMRGSVRRCAILVSDFKGAFRFSAGSGYLVGCPIRCLYYYAVMSEELTAR